MQIPKEKIVSLLRERGQDSAADQAEQRLPDQVDLEEHRDELQKIGVNPDDLLGGELGGLGNKLGL